MVRLRTERFPSGASKKLHASSVGPIDILSRLRLNAYGLVLLADWGICPTFNVQNLVKFRGSISIPSNPFERPSLSDPKPTSSTIPNTPFLPNTPKCEEKDKLYFG